tara:strand:+ start:1727 stop:3178 length:1452 start_codon:yes stop_codon:yes gene_type:complete
MAYIGQGIKQGTFKVLDTSGNTYNGSNTTFNLGTQVGSAAQLLVSHDGVIQKAGTDYTLATGGTQITFSTAPASGASIFIVEISGAVGGTVTPSDNSVGITQLNVSDGSSGQALTTNGSGTLSFASVGLAGIDDQSSSNDDQLTITDTAVVINEDSDDVDFRVESNGNANMLFVSGGNDVVGIGAEGDLGSGLHIKASDCGGGSVSANSDNLVLEENGNVGLTMLGATNGGSHLFFGHSGDEDEGFLTYDNDNNRMRFGVNGTEGMRLLGTEVLCIGTTSASGSPSTSCLELKGTESPLSIINETATDSSDRTSIAMRNSSGTLVGNVGVDNSSTVFNTSSDYRLKENKVAISDGITRIKQLKPYKFNFKIQADKTVDGFFAHEVTPVVPEAITGEKDATETLQKVVLDSSGNIVAFNVEQSKWTQGKTDGDYANDTTWEASKEIIKPQSIDQSKLVPLLTAALQEAITEIESLKARVTTLEG